MNSQLARIAAATLGTAALALFSVGCGSDLGGKKTSAQGAGDAEVESHGDVSCKIDYGFSYGANRYSFIFTRSADTESECRDRLTTRCHEEFDSMRDQYFVLRCQQALNEKDEYSAWATRFAQG